MVVGTMDALRDRVKACVSAGPRPARVGAGFGSRPRRAREAALRALPFAEGQRRLVLARAKPGGEGSRYEPKSDGAGSDGAAPEPTGDLGILPNTARYALYFVSVLSGTAYVALRPVGRFMGRSPLAALAVIGSAAGLYAFVSFIVQAMLGVNGDPLGGPVIGGTGAI